MRLEKRILVVDDEDPIRALVVTVLRRRGYRLDTARHGVEALEKLAACRYSLVVLDLMMPHKSGYDVLDELAAMPVARRPLVLVLTAALEPRPFDSQFIVGTIQKPFDIALLVDTVDACLGAVEPAPKHELCPDPRRVDVHRRSQLTSDEETN